MGGNGGSSRSVSTSCVPDAVPGALHGILAVSGEVGTVMTPSLSEV